MMGDEKIMKNLVDIFKYGARPESFDIVVDENDTAKLIVKMSVPEKIDLEGNELTNIYDPDTFLKTCKVVVGDYYEAVEEGIRELVCSKYNNQNIVMTGFKMYGKIRKGETWTDLHALMELAKQKELSTKMINEIISCGGVDAAKEITRKRAEKYIKREEE